MPDALNSEIQKIYSHQQTKISLSILKNFYFLFETDINLEKWCTYKV